MPFQLNFRRRTQPPKQRPTWTTAWVRPEDLVDLDVIRVGRDWRLVLDVWRPGDDWRAQFGDEHTYAQELRDALDTDPAGYVVVRYVLEESSTDGETRDGFARYRLPELIEIQIPA